MWDPQLDIFNFAAGHCEYCEIVLLTVITLQGKCIAVVLVMVWEALPEEHQGQQHQQLSVLAHFVLEELLGIFNFGAGLPQECKNIMVPLVDKVKYIVPVLMVLLEGCQGKVNTSESSFTFFYKGCLKNLLLSTNICVCQVQGFTCDTTTVYLNDTFSYYF